MPIKTIEERKKQQKLLILVLVIIIVVLAILYFSFFKREASVQQGATLDATKSAAGLVLEEKLKKVDLDTEFLINIILPFLKVHGNLPVEKGITGRPDPFIVQ